MPWIKPNLQKTEFLRILTGNILTDNFLTGNILTGNNSTGNIWAFDRWYLICFLALHLIASILSFVRSHIELQESLMHYHFHSSQRLNGCSISVCCNPPHRFLSNRQSSGLFGPLQRSLNYIRTTFRCPNCHCCHILVRMVGAIMMWTLPDTSSAS